MINQGVSGDVAYTIWLEHTSACVVGQTERAPIVLRVTHLFRREGGHWTIIHRHADPVIAKTAPAAVLQR